MQGDLFGGFGMAGNLCANCNRIAVLGGHLCQGCLDSGARYKKTKKQNGLCVNGCGRPISPDSMNWCDVHLKLFREYDRARRSGGVKKIHLVSVETGRVWQGYAPRKKSQSGISKRITSRHLPWDHYQAVAHLKPREPGMVPDHLIPLLAAKMPGNECDEVLLYELSFLENIQPATRSKNNRNGRGRDRILTSAAKHFHLRGIHGLDLLAKLLDVSFREGFPHKQEDFFRARIRAALTV